MNDRRHDECPECASLPQLTSPIDRRSFLRAAGGAALAGAAVSAWPNLVAVHAAPSPKSAAETTVAEFYKTLSADQKKIICFDFDNALRKKIDANWHITKPLISNDFYSKEQRGLIDQIVRKITSNDGYERFIKQMEDDDGGIGQYTVAVFGEPGSGKFEWELTGRHLTLRADGDSVDKAAFGGPIVYGHGDDDPAGNLFHYQTKQVNEVFKALDAKQSAKAAQKTSPSESAVALQGDSGKFPGIGVSELSADQKNLVEDTLKVLLAPYRSEDVEEVMGILKTTGGVDKLHFAFYQDDDLKNDKVWDVWRVEGPSFVWHFRGAPHVHAYINIGIKS